MCKVVCFWSRVDRIKDGSIRGSCVIGLILDCWGFLMIIKMFGFYFWGIEYNLVEFLN